MKAANAAKAAKTFTAQQVETFALNATKQPGKGKVMLGKFEGLNNPNSYHKRAGNDHTFFELDEWTEVSNMVGGKQDEMWKINKKFIDNQKALGDDFYLSHNPNNPDYYKGFYKMEIDYLTTPISQGGLGGSIDDLGNNLWKIVW